MSVINFDESELFVEFQFKRVCEFNFITVLVPFDFLELFARPSACDCLDDLTRDVLVVNRWGGATDFLPFPFAVEFDFQTIGKMHVIGSFKQIRIFGYIRNGLPCEVCFNRTFCSRRKLLIIKQLIHFSKSVSRLNIEKKEYRWPIWVLQYEEDFRRIPIQPSLW